MILLLACNGGDTDVVVETGLADPIDFPLTIGPEDRPTEVTGPEDWRGVGEIPVVFMLHGYAANAAAQDLVLRLSTVVDSERFLLVWSEGTKDDEHLQFWNATDECCDFDDKQPDDVGYLIGLLDELEADWPISEVYFIGHSNGAYMSYRMACEHPSRITAIAPLAGSSWLDPDDCTVGDPVSVLHMHPTDDDRVLYEGGTNYPSAEDLVLRWAERAGCSGSTSGEDLDLIPSIEGSETSVTNYTGCGDHKVTLWSHKGAGHVPIFDQEFPGDLMGWLTR